MEKIRSDLECKTKYNKGVTRNDWAMDRNEVKSKLSNPNRVCKSNPVSTIKAKRYPAYPGNRNILRTRRKGNQPRLY